MSDDDYNDEDLHDARHENDCKEGKFDTHLTKRKYRATIDDDESPLAEEQEVDLTGKPTSYSTEAEAIVDTDLPNDADERRQVVVEAEAPPLPRKTTDKIARGSRNTALKQALQEFNSALGGDDRLRTASGLNKRTKHAPDRQRYTESFHIRDQITKRTFSADDAVNNRLSMTLHRLKADLDSASIDALCVSVHVAANDTPSPDYGMQKDKNGKYVFEGAMTLDRKRVLNRPRQGDGIVEGIHDGSVRRAKSHRPVEFDSYRDEPLAASAVDARNRLEEIGAALGPLWRTVQDALQGNWTLSRVGESFGKSGPQASAVGTAIMGLALSTAGDGYDRIDGREASEAAYIDWLDTQDDGMPVPARRLKRALSPYKPASIVFRQNREEKPTLLAVNDNHSQWLNDTAA